MAINTVRSFALLSISVFMLGCNSSDDANDNWYENVHFEHPKMAACFIESAKALNWSNVDEVTSFNCHHKDIDSIVGIEQFKNLADLHLSNTALKEIALHGNPELKNVLLSGNALLKSVDLSSNLELTDVHIWSNQIQEINLSHLPKLHTVYLFMNRIREINLDGIDVEFLDLRNNLIETIDLSNARSIRQLMLSENPLTQLDLSNLHDLRALFVIGTEINDIDLSFNWELTGLSLMDNNINEIRFDNNPNLVRVNIEGNPLNQETLDYFSTIDWIEDFSY